MQLATHASLVLARFDDLRETGPVAGAGEDCLFLMAGADVRAAATDPKSQRAFKFVVYGLHTSEESAKRSVDERLTLCPWLADAKEVWGAVLKPFRHFGEANYLQPDAPAPVFDVTTPDPADGKPIVVVTSAGWNRSDLDMERVREFGAGVTGVRISMTGVPGLHSQQTFSFPGGLDWDGITVTMWKDFVSMRDFAYGPGMHVTQLKRQRSDGLGDRTSFTRFIPLESVGAWHGSDPLA